MKVNGLLLVGADRRQGGRAEFDVSDDNK